MKHVAQRLVKAQLFEPIIIGLILLNGLVLGLETSPRIAQQYGHLLNLTNHLILACFIIEAFLKIASVFPRIGQYFGDGWNVFDFSVIVFSLIPATGEFAMIARLARLLRVVRLISTIPELRLIVATLVRSIPSMGHVMLLMSIVFYIYAITGYHLFHEHDPVHWSSLGMSLLSLFRIVTLEDWTDIMYKAMEWHPMAWLYFVSFVVLGTFVVVNLFIAVVINNLDEAKNERLRELQKPGTRDELLRDIRLTQDALKQLEVRIKTIQVLDPNEKSHGVKPGEQRQPEGK